MVSSIGPWYCWCFRNPKQPPGMYKTLLKEWDKLPFPQLVCRILEPSTVLLRFIGKHSESQVFFSFFFKNFLIVLLLMLQNSVKKQFRLVGYPIDNLVLYIGDQQVSIAIFLMTCHVWSISTGWHLVLLSVLLNKSPWQTVKNSRNLEIQGKERPYVPGSKLLILGMVIPPSIGILLIIGI